jgi:hypothetical protein
MDGTNKNDKLPMGDGATNLLSFGSIFMINNAVNLGVFGRAPRSFRSRKPTPLQNLSAKHNQLQQLHRGSAPKNGGAGPNSMVFME